MNLDPADRLAIHELVALHGHLVDSGQFERMSELFTPDIRYDVTAYGFGVLEGIQARIAARKVLPRRHPLHP